MKNITAILAVLMMIFVGLACSGEETEKANGLVGEANKFIVEGNKNVTDAETKGTEFDKKVTEIDSDDDHKAVSEFGEKELIPLYDKMKDNFQKAGDKFEEAGKLKLNEKYKEYLTTKAAEFKKRAEYAESLKAIPKTLSASKAAKDYSESVKKDVEKSQKLLKEAQELADKATKIQKDNPTVIQQS
jgi:tetratricopeptide (TPR) repeat protein